MKNSNIFDNVTFSHFMFFIISEISSTILISSFNLFDYNFIIREYNINY